MQRFIFSDGTTEVEIQNILGFEGLNMPPVRIKTTQGFRQHGASVRWAGYEPRPFTILFDVRGDDYEDAADQRSQIAGFFSSLTPKTLKYIRGDIERNLGEVYPSGVYDTEGLERNILNGTLQLIAYDPLFYKELGFTSVSIETAVHEYVDSDGGMEYIDSEGGIEYSTIQQGVTVQNDGNSPESPAIIRFVAPALNPWVTNETTGQTITVEKELVAGETLEVNTKTAQVEIIDSGGDRHDAFSYISDDPDLFEFIKLAPGENVFSFGTEGSSVGYIEVGGYEYYTNI